ncbi:DUF1569 domain-containing protein [Pedobacter xixiisoli]|uniref:DUF1569 domain-containing protein n=1 Tax=Pedobacter xixiisoli TaxID=1476464 RepID=A0A286AAM3_9SPHI|nr:DUF1569 domain-containing protein [Pedobacter xixiisoli]SOD18877.1 Protein of unknown function [Pedobacter xixiisoli]
MDLPNIFTKEVAEEVIGRIEKLTPVSQPLWGKMNAAQMFAHCCVAYEMVYTDKHAKPNFFMGFILKNFIKKAVVSDKPYSKNSKTAPAFLISDEKDFEAEKQRLVDYIRETQVLGAYIFDGKMSHSFGPLSDNEWNNMFYKHLDHHLKQFGV